MRKFLKKIMVPALVLAMAVSMMVPAAFAATPSLNIPSITIPTIKPDFSNLNITIPNSYFPGGTGTGNTNGNTSQDSNNNEAKDEVIEFETELENPPLIHDPVEVPVISSAKYVHASRYVKGHLDIKWNKIENAKSYDVLITKADGETITYTTTTNSLYKVCGCTRVYIEETSTWASTTVQVRAIVEDNPCCTSAWSEPVTFGCNQLHNF